MGRGQLSAELRQQLDALVERFEASWGQAEQPLIEELLPAEEPLRTAVLIELVHADLELRLKAGHSARVEEYVERFSQLGEDRDVLQELVQTEYNLRAKREPDLLPNEYRHRFPDLPRPKPPAKGIHTHCPHCHNPIELVDESSFREILCPSCGSSFSLISTDTTATRGGGSTAIAHFELLEQLGVGHFGAVWKARDTRLHRTVAVKLPRSEQLGPSETEQFFREARAAAQLKHPHIVSVHEVGRQENSIYIVSDYVQGANLKEWMTGQKLTNREAVELVITVAEALHHAHEQGVIHRDLKPGNIMMDLEGQPHLMDFGLAKREAGEITMTVEGKILGTPAYMPPEQARGEGHNADRRSDVYSLGVILYELLTGELPFRGETRMLIVQILKDEPPSPRKLDASIPKDLETICLKCLEKDPARRYQTAQDLADDLRRWQKHEPIAARPIGRIERGARWCRRNAVIAGSAVAVITALLMGTVFASWFAVQAMRAAEREAVARTEAEQNAQKESAARHSALLAKEEAELSHERERMAREDADLHAEQSLREKQRAEMLVYTRQIALAQREWENGHAGRARSALDECAWNLRGWEHAYLQTLFNQNQTTLEGHSGGVRSVAFSPDGTRIVSGSGDGTLKVWSTATVLPDSAPAPPAPNTEIKVKDTANGQETLTFNGHSGAVWSVAFSPDGTRIVSGGEDHTLKVWDATSGEETLTLTGHSSYVTSVAFSPDGTRIVSGSEDTTIKIWDAASGQETLTLAGHSDTVRSVAFSPDATQIVSGGDDNTIKVWDAASGQETLTLSGHNDTVRSVAFSPDGTRIVSGSGDGTLKVWSTATARLASAPAPPAPNTEIKVKDTANGQETITFKGHSGAVWSVAFSPDGTRIVSGSKDNTLKVWDATGSQETLTLTGHSGGVTSVAFSPDGTRIVSGSEDTTIKVWDAASGQETLTLKGHSGTVNSVAFSPDGTRIVSGSRDGTLKVWDTAGGQETLTLKGHSDGVTSVAFSPDGTRIVSGSGDATIKVWDATGGQEFLTLHGHSNGVLCVTFSSDGKQIVSGSFDETVKVWDADSGQVLLSLPGHGGAVRSVAFSPDSTRIVSGSDDNTIKVWDAASGQETLTLRGHSDGVTSLAFSPDGTRIVSGSGDGTIKVWDGSGYNLNKDSLDMPEFFGVPRSGDGTIKVWDGSVADGEKKSLAFTTPDFDLWVNEVAALPAEQQLDAVSKKLQELNPEFDGKMAGWGRDSPPGIVDGVVVELGFCTGRVDDISPVRALKGLKVLSVGGWYEKGKLSDLSPLHDMDLQYLACHTSYVSDLTPIGHMRLICLHCYDTPIRNIDSLQNMPLAELACKNTHIADFSVLEECETLLSLELYGTPIKQDALVVLKKSLPRCNIVSDLPQEP